jgi:outer membrane protein assembly factor BamB
MPLRDVPQGTSAGSRFWGAVALGLYLSFAPTAAAQSPALPPLPPIGGTPSPPGERPPPEPSPPGPVSPAPGSVTENVDVAQSGFFPDDQLIPPLVRRWSYAAPASNVLAADGRVYVLEPYKVTALDQADGRVLWTAGGFEPSFAAYDAGTLFVMAPQSLTALRADSGAQLWRIPFGEPSGGNGPPVASGGVVYAVAGSYLYAVAAADGKLLWKVEGLKESWSPAIDNDRVYLGGESGGAAALARQDGNRLWGHRAGDCDTKAHVTPALHAGRLYVPRPRCGGGSPPIFDASNGNAVGSFTYTRAPVFVDGLAVYPERNQVRAVDLGASADAWRFKQTPGAVIAIGHDVYVLTVNRLRALDSERGEVLWSAVVPWQPPGDTARLAAAPGLLLAVTDGWVTAYESAFKPGPREVLLATGATEVSSGGAVSLGGVLGRDLRAGRPTIEIQAAPWRKGRFGPTTRIRMSRDGGFAGGAEIYRNVRLRAAVAGEVSKPVVVYAWPRVKLGRASLVGRTRLRMNAVVRTANRNLGGRTFVLYLNRPGSKRLTRLASARLRGGRRARATLRFRMPHGNTAGALLYYCIRGQLELDLGRPSALTTRCGAGRLPRS